MGVARELDIKVVGAGAARTGTQSLAIALWKLGYSPLHAATLDQNFAIKRPWCEWALGNGSFEPLREMMADGGYNAVLDQPMVFAFEALMHQFPESKVILTLHHHSSEKWYDSYHDAWRNGMAADIDMNASIPGYLAARFLRPEALAWHRAVHECHSRQYAKFGCDFEHQVPETRQMCVTAYEQHVSRVMSIVPSDRLLVYKVTEGWGPLCRFLNKSVPEEPFPRFDGFKNCNAECRRDGARKEIVAFACEEWGIFLKRVFSAVALLGTSAYFAQRLCFRNRQQSKRKDD